MIALAGLIVVIYVAVSGLYTGSPAAPLANLGAAPEIGIKTPDRILKLSDIKGKVVLIDFWATWCGPCRMSIPGIQKLYADKQKEGFEVIGVAMEHGDDKAVPGFVRQMGMTYPVGLCLKQKSVENYVKSGRIPAMAIVDRKGNLRWLQEGYSAAIEAQMVDYIERLLAES